MVLNPGSSSRHSGRIIRVDPRDGSEATDLDLHDFLGKAWGMNVGYTIAAYNNMTRVRG